MKRIVLIVAALFALTCYAQENNDMFVDLLEAGVPHTHFDSPDGNRYLYYSPRYGSTDTSSSPTTSTIIKGKAAKTALWMPASQPL